MKKEEQLIMVVRNDLLFRDGYFEGFRGPEEVDFQRRILENFLYMKRGEAEEDERYKQPIGYAVLRDKSTGKIFAYRRASKKEDYNERRLRGKWSWGVGGHVDKPDEKGLNPIKGSVLRELEEEIIIEGKVEDIRPIGYINDDSNSVGRVHFGILYLVDFSGKVFPADAEIEKGEMRTIKELSEMSDSEKCEVEDWSKISLQALKEV